MYKAGTSLALVTLVVAFSALAVPSTVSPAAASRVAVQAPPNVVIILTDDQRLGLEDAMPVLRRRIQAPGVTFTNYMVPTALCCPSRASLLTGMFAHGTHVWNNGVPGDPPLTGGYRGFVANGNDNRTLAVALDAEGYQTALVGKYLNGFIRSSPTPPGWDTFEPFQGPLRYYDYYMAGQRYGQEPRDYSTDVVKRRAVKVIEDADGEPLFLYVAPYGPHAPYTPAPRHQSAPASGLVSKHDFYGIHENVRDKPRWLRKLPEKKFKHQRYVARQQHRAMMSIDEMVGAILDALKRKGILQNTLIIFTSDNGLTWGEHHYAGKGVPYRQATEVPLVVRWDAGLKSGISRSRLAVNVDLTATVASAAAADMPWTEGKSLFAIAHRSGFPMEASYGHSPVPYRPAYCGWRTLDRMYVRYSTGAEELYLYKQDPYELHNVANIPKYKNALQDMRKHAKAACFPTPPTFAW